MAKNWGYHFIRILVLSVALLTGQSGICQSEYKFTTYDFRHGLPVEHIHCLAQDSLGYLWIGTPNGVIRFDGFTFRHFTTNSRDSNAIKINDISIIEVSPDGIVWVGAHDQGMSYFDRNNDRWVSLNQETHPESKLFQSSIAEIHFGRDDHIYIGGGARGLYKLNAKSLDLSRVDTFLSLTTVREISNHPTDEDKLLVGAVDLFEFDMKSAKLEKLITPDRIWNNWEVDEYGRFWGHRYDIGIGCADLDNQTVKRFEYPVGRLVNDICITKSGQAWVALQSAGIRVIDVHTFEEDEIRPVSFSPWSIPTNQISAILETRNGQVWIGTHSGLCLYDPEKQIINNEKLRISDTESKVTHAVIPLNDEEHLAATYYSGLILKQDIVTKTSKEIYRSGQSEDIGSPFQFLRINDAIYATGSKGIGRYRPEREDFVKIQIQTPGDEYGKVFVLDSDQDEDGRIWAVDNRCIAFRIDPLTGVSDTFHICSRDGSTPRSISYHQNGVWIGLTDGVMLLDSESRGKTFFYEEEYPYFDRGTNDVRYDQNGDVWVAGYTDLLHRFSFDGVRLKHIKSYGIEHGLMEYSQGSIEMASDGTILVSSGNGFSFYDPETDYFRSLSIQDGISINPMNGILVDDDHITLLGHTGYSHLKLQDLKSIQPQIPRLNIERITLAQNEYHVEDTDKLIEVPYYENDFQIDYVGINFTNPTNVRYAYRLLPDEQWTYTSSNERTARFANLVPGEYHFELKSSSDGLEWSEVKKFSFEITPPFWKTWWFIFLCALALIALIVAAIQWRLRQVKLSEQTKSRMAELELKALRSQMNPHFMFNSLNSIKNFILKSKPGEAAQYLSSFAHLIRMILQNSREKTVSLSQELETLLLYIELEKLRFKKGFEFACEVDETLNLDHVRIPPMLLQPYVENAIWHGLMHKEDDAVLALRFQRQNGSILCIVEDNGIGREKAMALKSSSARRYKSMGMGITKDRIDIHNQMNALGIKVDIVDKSNDRGDATGTKVSIEIPGNHKE